ncbi:MAG: sulfatase-like hydrolase/transferase [Streptosporangiales bacterium]|nr:sulfatase-like hydrolase/transferase [Streptosporangiales bacterium]
MGFSDLGCYGGEVDTPAVDQLAERGVRFANFYATPRCSPSRASLLTGLHPHQTGIGVLTNDDRPRGYPGNLNRNCVTLAEVLREAGYATALCGKWHLSSDMWNANDAWPTRRGFDHYFGTLTGCGSFFWPGTLTRGEQSAEHEPLGREFYYTDAISDEAQRFVQRHVHDAPEQPFFLYLAYTAPHWPLHALEEDIDKYEGTFDAGWDELRERRLERLVQLGLLPPDTQLSDRDPSRPAWADEPDKEWQLARMRAYAAQIDRMDQGIARLLATLDETGVRDDTIVVFLSDNGASDEDLPKVELERFRKRHDILRVTTRDGKPVHIGNTVHVTPGAEDTYASYGRAWANLSTTPFRYYKRWVHEGGIATPMVVSWPAGGLAEGDVVRAPFQLTDVLPTIIDATGAEYPDSYAGHTIPPAEGRSMLPALTGADQEAVPLFWEHTGNVAVRRGRWKLVREYGDPWELYDLETDRTELVDLAPEHPEIVQELATAHEKWADRVGVIPWEETLAIYQARGEGDMEAAG